MRLAGIVLLISLGFQACSVRQNRTTIPLMPDAIPLAQRLQKDHPAVLIFLDSECPICCKYTLNIRKYAVQYPDVQWIGVFTRWHSPEQIRAFAQTYNLDIPLYLDPANRLIRKLGIKVTPEVVLMNSNGKRVYRGAIDNWFFGLGKHRPAATENYLIDAIEAQGRGEAPKISRTTPIGCVIQQ